jgi:hypothetical protein
MWVVVVEEEEEEEDGWEEGEGRAGAVLLVFFLLRGLAALVAFVLLPPLLRRLLVVWAADGEVVVEGWEWILLPPRALKFSLPTLSTLGRWVGRMKRSNGCRSSSPVSRPKTCTCKSAAS